MTVVAQLLGTLNSLDLAVDSLPWTFKLRPYPLLNAESWGEFVDVY